MTVWRVDVIDPRTGYRMWTERHCSAMWRAKACAWVVQYRYQLDTRIVEVPAT